MGKNRLELRRMAEAAERQKTTTEKTDKPAAKKRKAAKRKTATRKTKARAVQRKRIVWCVYSGSMKEEGRFAYDQKEAAEAKLAHLKSKSKKQFFMQAVKEVIGDAPEEEKEVAVKKVKKAVNKDETPEGAEEESDDEDE